MKSPQPVMEISPNTKSEVSNTTLGLVAVGNLIAHASEHIFAMSLAPILVLILNDIPMTLTEIGILGTVQVVPTVVLGLVYGIMADKYGSKYFVIGGAFFSSIGIYMTAQVTTYQSLLLIQILLGIALSAYHPTGLCMVTRVYSKRPEALGRGLSIQSIGGAGGSGTAPLLMVALSKWSGTWQGALEYSAILGFGATIIITVMLLFVNEKVDTYEEIRFPKASNTKRNIKNETKGLLTISFMFLIIFAFTRSSVFRNAMVFFPYYFESLGYSVFMAGVFTSLFFGIGAIFQVIGGILADKVASMRNIFLLSSILAGISCLVLTVVKHEYGIIIALLIFGGSFFIAIPSMSVSVSRHAPMKSQGTIFAIFFAAISVFGALSSTLFGIIGDIWSMQVGLVFVASLCLFGALFVNKIQEKPLKVSNPTENV